MVMAKLSDFLPTSAKEVKARGWEELDVILFSGDAYVDHPSFGAAVIGRILEAEGLRVAIVRSCRNWATVRELWLSSGDSAATELARRPARFQEVGQAASLFRSYGWKYGLDGEPLHSQPETAQ